MPLAAAYQRRSLLASRQPDRGFGNFRIGSEDFGPASSPASQVNGILWRVAKNISWGGSMPDDLLSSFIVAAEGLAPQVAAFAEEGERSRQLPLPLVESIARAGLFRLWIPQALGGPEVDPMTFLRVVETISRVDGSAGWCQLIAGSLSVFAGYLPMAGAQQIFGCDPLTVLSGSFAPFGQAVVEPGGYRVTGRWPLASGCQSCAWLVGNCRVVDGDRPRLRSDGTPVTRMMMLPASTCQILDTWDSVGLRATGSHDYTVTNIFVPDDHSLSFREPPVQSGPLYALPSIALFAAAVAAVPLGIARHAIDLVTHLAAAKVTIRSRRTLREDAGVQADLGRAEALLRSGRAFLYETLEDAWRVVSAGGTLDVVQRALLLLAGTHAANSATQAVDLMFNAGSSASVYESAGLGRCLRDIRTAGQHIAVIPFNYGMAGQALLGFEMGMTMLMLMDDRSD
jgi:alkylation response protein AidB-like acyl-CoA dehydrogenase